MAKDTGLGRFLLGFSHAGRGVALAGRQRNFRVHLVATGAVLLLGAGLGVSPLEWALLILCIFWVLGMEAMNSALEALANRVCREPDPLIGQAKDLAAGAVLLSALGAAGVGLVILLPRLWGALG